MITKCDCCGSTDLPICYNITLPLYVRFKNPDVARELHRLRLCRKCMTGLVEKYYEMKEAKK